MRISKITRRGALRPFDDLKLTQFPLFAKARTLSERATNRTLIWNLECAAVAIICVVYVRGSLAALHSIAAGSNRLSSAITGRKSANESPAAEPAD